MTPAEYRRRRELETVLRPIGKTCCQHLDFAISLALTYGWTVKSSHDGGFWAGHSTRTIRTRPLASDQDFAEFLHECGHVQDSQFHRRNSRKAAQVGWTISIEREAVAWLWAVRTAGYRWNQAMQAHLASCLKTYIHFNDTRDDLDVIEAVIAHGQDKAEGVVRLRPAPLSPLMTHLYQQACHA